MKLPRLREELSVLPGPKLPDGQPSWTLHDPARNLFYRIDWPTFEILQRWSLNDPFSIIEDIDTHTTLQLTTEDVNRVTHFLLTNQLAQMPESQTAQHMAEQWHAMQGTWLKRILHQYLFFRIPIWCPDPWLNRCLPRVTWFYSRSFLWWSSTALLFGLTQVVRRWDVFIHSLVDTLNWDGMLAYGMAIFLVKGLHELGHAFTAKRFGCRVPTMGIAFLVMWPVAYTDTNEVWRLTNRWQRLQVAIAGIAVELLLAVWATCAWGLLPDGSAKSIAFVLATSSWLTTLFINANPFMRFDGYFILSDWLDWPNLHERSFAMARWQLREILFKLGDAPPEHLTPHRQHALIIFAWCVWWYRLILFFGIALLVYHQFFKALGMVLFGVEMVWFILHPLWREVRIWGNRWKDIRMRHRSKQTAIGFLALLLAISIPWPGRITASAILRPNHIWPIFVPTGARLDAMYFQEGHTVPLNEVLFKFYVPDLNLKQKNSVTHMDQLRWQAATSGFSTEMRHRLLTQESIVLEAETQLNSVNTELQFYEPRAPFTGVLRDTDPDLQIGQWLSKREKIALLVQHDGPWLAETWLDEESVQRIQVGSHALFVGEGVEHPSLSLTVASIDKDATRVLPKGELATPFGGHVLVREKSGQFFAEQAVYHVVFQPTDQPAIGEQRLTRRGTVTVDATWEAPVWRYLSQAIAVLVREAGF